MICQSYAVRDYSKGCTYLAHTTKQRPMPRRKTCAQVLSTVLGTFLGTAFL